MQLKPITAIAVLLLVVVLVSISGCISSNNAATATPTAAASNVPTAAPTVKPTAAPTSVPINLILVERPASASGPDRTAEINANMGFMKYHRVTIDGHDAYAYTGAISDYVFPCSSYSEAQTLQASYVAKFQANGFTVSSSTQDVWGPNSILTGLKSGSTEVVISASDSATVTPLTNILDTGSEMDILIDLHK
jgi:hypothetical protein